MAIKKKDIVIRANVTEENRKLIEKASELAEVSMSEVIRFGTMEYAKKIIKEKEEKEDE